MTRWQRGWYKNTRRSPDAVLRYDLQTFPAGSIDAGGKWPRALKPRHERARGFLMERLNMPDVLRWHCHPDPALRNSGDGINRHQRAVVALVQDLCAYLGHPLHDSDLPAWCAVHDEPEREMGDWPAPLCAVPSVAFLKSQLEREYRATHDIAEPDMTAHEWDIFHLCDKAEARIWAMSCGADLTRHGWPEYDARLRRMAWKVGPDAVQWLAGKL